MSSKEPSVKHGQSIGMGQRVAIALVRVDVAYHSQLYSDYSDKEIQCIKDSVRGAFHAIAEYRGGKPYTWEGDGGSFVFPIEDGDSFNNCCLSAIQMLEMMPSINQDVRSSAGPECPLEVRLSCDTGMVSCEPEPSALPGEFVARLTKYRRQVGVANRVTITERIYRQLAIPFRSRFVSWKHSAELEADLYSTPPLTDQSSPPAPLPSSHLPAILEERPEQPGFLPPAGPGEERPPERGSPQAPPGRVRAWQKVGVVLGAVLLVGLFTGWAVTRFGRPAAPVWNEPVRTPEWTAWRNRVHEQLSGGRVTEGALVEALRMIPRPAREEPAAVLRRDQAIADVLLSYEGVQSIFGKRFGIGRDFLGTGLSKPVGDHDYSCASLHEYLIPNYPDDHPEVWTWQLQPIGPNFRRRVREIIAGDPAEKQDRIPPTRDIRGTFEQNLADVIMPRLKERNMALPPVIRFAKFPGKFYSGKMGRKDAVRVFASNLSEVWDLSVQDAAKLSGYTFGAGSEKGDVFFIWVFVPNHQDEVVPATWGEVLSRLPGWIEDRGSKAP